MLAVIIRFLFLEAYPSIWRMNSSSICSVIFPGRPGWGCCLCFLICSMPILKITWSLFSKESAGTFPHCHYISRNQTVAFQWHWSSLPAPVDAASLGPWVSVCSACRSGALQLPFPLQSKGFLTITELWLPHPHPACPGNISVSSWVDLRVTVVIGQWCLLWYVRVSSTNLCLCTHT